MSIKERSSIKNFTITAGASGVLLITSVFVYDVGGVVSLFFWMLPLAMLQYFLSSRKKRYIVFSILSLFLAFYVPALLTELVIDFLSGSEFLTRTVASLT